MDKIEFFLFCNLDVGIPVLISVFHTTNTGIRVYIAKFNIFNIWNKKYRYFDINTGILHP